MQHPASRQLVGQGQLAFDFRLDAESPSSFASPDLTRIPSPPAPSPDPSLSTTGGETTPPSETTVETTTGSETLAETTTLTSAIAGSSGASTKSDVKLQTKNICTRNVINRKFIYCTVISRFNL